MAQGYERKDNRPKRCFKGIWTKDHLVKDFTPVLCSSIFLFYFWCSIFSWDSSFISFSQLGFFPVSFFLLAFASIFACLCFSRNLHILISSRVSSVLFSWASKLDCLWSWKDSSCIFFQCGRWSLVKVNERNHQAQKRTTNG